MSPATLAQHYRDNQINTSSPAETVLMLYDGMIKFLRAAIERLEQGDVEEKAKLIEKAVNIIDYLQSCLDKEKGGEIAVNLDRLYGYMMIQLTEANLKNDRVKIDDVIILIQPIRDAWAEISKSNGNGKSAQQATPTYAAGMPVGELTARVTVKV